MSYCDIHIKKNELKMYCFEEIRLSEVKKNITIIKTRSFIISGIRCLTWYKSNFKLSVLFSQRIGFGFLSSWVHWGWGWGVVLQWINCSNGTATFFFCPAVLWPYSRAMLLIVLIATPHGKAQGRLQWKGKVVSEKINLFSWYLAARLVLSHTEGNCNCHNISTLGTYFYALPGGLASFEANQLSLMW